MLRICRKCQVEYEGAPGSTLCPACVKDQRSTTIRQRTCRSCGASFPGGPRAWYCPSCRHERQLKHDREAYHRAKAGKTRKLGSEDICTICGTPYTVTSARQCYCPACAPDAYAASDRQQALEYYAAHRDPDGRRELRQAHSAQLICVICGTPYTPTSAAKTCSDSCSAVLKKQLAAKFEKNNRERRNQQQRERYAKRKEKKQENE